MSDASERMANARRLLADPLLVEVLDSIELAAVTAWASTGIAQTDDRERVYHSYKAAQRVRTVLKGIVDNGLIEASRATTSR